MKKMLFVFNPYSGKGQIRFLLFNIINSFTKAGFSVTVHPTQAKLDALETIKSIGESYDVIVCGGGDGTLNEAITAVMGLNARIPIGFIATGTVNDFSRSLAIPKNIPKAVSYILENRTSDVDIGSFNDRYFTYIAGFGLFTDVSYETSQNMKNVLGNLAYIIETMNLRRLSNTKSYRVKFEHDGETIEDDFIYGMVCNSNSIGGIKGFGGNDILLNDGFFEVLFIKMPKNIVDFQLTVNKLIMREYNSEYLYHFKTREIYISSEEDLPWTLDGEFGGNCKAVQIKNNYKAITIYTPPDNKLLGGHSDLSNYDETEDFSDEFHIEDSD